MNIDKMNQFVKEQSVYPIDCYYKKIKELKKLDYDNLIDIFGVFAPFTNEQEAVAFANEFIHYIEFNFVDSFFKKNTLNVSLRRFMFQNMPYHFDSGYFEHSFKNEFTTIEDFIEKHNFIRENVYFYFFDLLFFKGKTDFSKIDTFFFKSNYEFSASLQSINDEIKNLEDYEELYIKFEKFQKDNIINVCNHCHIPF